MLVNDGGFAKLFPDNSLIKFPSKFKVDHYHKSRLRGLLPAGDQGKLPQLLSSVPLKAKFPRKMPLNIVANVSKLQHLSADSEKSNSK